MAPLTWLLNSQVLISFFHFMCLLCHSWWRFRSWDERPRNQRRTWARRGRGVALRRPQRPVVHVCPGKDAARVHQGAHRHRASLRQGHGSRQRSALFFGFDYTCVRFSVNYNNVSFMFTSGFWEAVVESQGADRHGVHGGLCQLGRFVPLQQQASSVSTIQSNLFNDKGLNSIVKAKSFIVFRLKSPVLVLCFVILFNC